MLSIPYVEHGIPRYHADDEREERAMVTIPRRIPPGPVHPTGLPFRLWCVMSIMSQVLKLGNIAMQPSNLMSIIVNLSWKPTRACLIPKSYGIFTFQIDLSKFPLAGIHIYSREVWLVDLFAGKARLSKAFAVHGYHTCTMDWERDTKDVACLVGSLGSQLLDHETWIYMIGLYLLWMKEISHKLVYFGNYGTFNNGVLIFVRYWEISFIHLYWVQLDV